MKEKENKMIKLFGGNEYIELKQWTFPAGERGVTIIDPNKILHYRNFTVRCNFEGNDDLIDMLLLVNACRNVLANMHLRLCIPYFPYSRQDRVASPGDAFALQVAANLIKQCDFWEVETWDAHSDVLAGMFAPGRLKNIPQHDLLCNVVRATYKGPGNGVALVAPDAGAAKKLFKLGAKLKLPVIEASKVRDTSTGNIIGCSITDTSDYSHLIIVDDICDGGATFIQLRNAIMDQRDNSPVKLDLVTTHGIYSKGKSLLYEYFDTVECVNDMRKDKNV